MSKINFKPGNMLYPLPAAMVSCGDMDGESNIITVAWTGTICTNPPMLYISLRPERHSYGIVRRSGEFVINLVTKELATAADFCGTSSGSRVDKWKRCGLLMERADVVKCPMIKQSPVNIECRVAEIKELGSHHMFIAEVVAVHVDEAYMDGSGAFNLNAAGLVAYSHGEYFTLGKRLGRFGYSVMKKKSGRKNKEKTRGGGNVLRDKGRGAAGHENRVS